MAHRRKKSLLTSAALLFLVLFGGCLELSGPEACTAEWVPGLDVTVERTDTGEPLADALVVARDGSFADSARTRLPPGDSGSAAARLAFERSGEYDVTVQKDGYEPSVRQDVRVDENDCHVETVELTVGLTPN